MNPGFHRVEGRGRVGGRGESGYPSPFLQASISFQEITKHNYSNNLITQIVTVAGKLQHDFFFIILLEFDK